ncbi:MAG: hypothetical protein ACLFUR_06415, partial [Candidatus Hadarchaeia archaeon]
MKFKEENIPKELKKRDQWVIWFEKKRNKKLTKLPAAPWSKGHWHQADGTDPKNWTSFKEAKKYAKKREDYGIGFSFSKEGPYTGIDFDNCVNEDNKIENWVSELVEKADSYTELSPSKTGLHIIGRSELEEQITSENPEVEVYPKNRFFTVTGKYLKGKKDIKEIGEVIEEIRKKYKNREEERIDYRGEEKSSLTVMDVLEKYYPDNDLKKHGEGLQGSHPKHGSDTGFNFKIVPEKNVWTCFSASHECGGGPFELLAVFEDIIKCGSWSWKDSTPLVGKKWIQVVQSAYKKNLITRKEAEKLTRKESEEEKEDVKEVPSVVTENFLAETVMNDGLPSFAVWNDGNLKYRDEIEYAGEVYKPYIDETVEKGAVKLPKEAKDYENVNELIDEIKDFINRWVDFSDKFLELSAWYVLLTWVHDRVSTIPYLRFLGDFGTGKTRAVKTIGGICYKAIDTAGATTAAAIERMVERWGGTLMMNEADFKQSDTDTNMVKILNEGFESTGCIIKAHKEKQDQVVVTNPYSPKILATRGKWDDQALESRCLTETMKETDRDDILPILTDEFYEKQQELRDKLLMFRFKNFWKIDENEVKNIWEKVQNKELDRRLIQATINFSILFWNDEEMFGRFNEFLEGYQQELREERSNTHEGRVADCVNKIMKNGGILTPSNIADKLEEEHNYDDVAPSSVGKWLKQLGLNTKVKRVDGGTKRVVKNDVEEILKILERYIPDEVEIASMGGTLENYSDSVTGVTDVSGVTDTSTNNNMKNNVKKKRGKGGNENEAEVSVTSETSVTPVTNNDKSQKELVEEILEAVEMGDFDRDELVDYLVEEKKYDRDRAAGHVDELLRRGKLIEALGGELEKGG